MTESVNRKFAKLGLGVSSTGTLTVNSATASTWQNARTITLDGDLSGNVSIDGSQNVTLTATVANNTVALGTDTTGNYVATVAAGSGISVSGSGSETAAVTVSIDNTVATLSGEQTLTNKTLTTPVIASITNTGILTLPTSTDTLVGRATADTLTNKTISGSNNTISNIANSSLTNSSITVNGTSIALGASGTLVTDDIAEDGTPVNLWYTDTRSRAAISVTDSGGDGSLAYNSGTGVITYTGPSATEVRAHFSGGTGVSITNGQIAIGQAVGTSDNVTFAGVTADNIRVGVTAAGEIDTSAGNLTIDSTGGTTVMDDDVNVTGNLLVDGNLTVSGTTVTVNATNLAVEDNMIYLNNGSAVTNPDLGFAGNYNDGTYRHAGIFRDASDGVWKFFHQYTPEPDASAYIDITHGTFALAPIQASTVTATTFTGALTGNVTGNASTATAWATGRTLTLSGDVTGTSAAFDGSGNISITTTIAANSVALGTDTTGDYVAAVAVAGTGLSVSGSGENATYTITSNATSANTASTIVARDASGNFTAGTITAALSGNATTATTLQTARNINGVSFNGSADITVADSTKLPLAGGTMTGQLVLNQNIVSPANYYNGLQLEVRATDGTAGIGLHRSGYSHVGIYTDASNVLKFNMNGGTVTLNHDTGIILGSGNYSSYALPLSGGTVTGNFIVQTGYSQVITGSITAANAGTRGLIMDGNYTDGRFRHRWRKYDDGNGIPLYLDYAHSSGNSYTAIARFGGGGTYRELDVYGTFSATTVLEGSNQVLHVGNYSTTLDTRYLYATSNPGIQGNFTLSIGNNGSYSYVQSHSSQPLELNPVGNTVRIAGNVVLHAGNYSSYAVPLAGGTMTGQLTINGAGLLLNTGGASTYGVVYGYPNNNHLITLRGQITGSTSSPSITDAHQQTFVEYAEANDTTGWFFKSSQPGTYTEVARITRTQINWNGNTVLHAGNYSSYALPLGGGTLTGTLGLPNNALISVNAEPDVWGARLRTTTSTTNLGAQLKNIIWCGGGVNEGFAVTGSGTGGAAFEVRNDGVIWAKSSMFSGGTVTARAFGSNAWSPTTPNSAGRVVSPAGAAASWDGGQTGAFKIRLPFRANNLMYRFTVKIYNYNASISTYDIGTYSYADGGYQSAAFFTGSAAAAPLTVRWGNDGSYDCVWIGETSSTWSYPVIAVTDFQGGFRNGEVSVSLSNWDITLVTSFGTVAQSTTPYIRLASGSTIDGNAIWHAGNDGSGSGLDADLLDGYNVGTSTNQIPYLNGSRNLSISSPETYSGEVRLGAAWNRGGVYAANGISVGTSGSFIDHVHSDVTTARHVYDANGSRFILGTNQTTTPYTLLDTNQRPTMYLRGGYPALVLDHTVTSNAHHGPTIQFVHDGLGARQWLIGSSGDGTKFDMGFSSSDFSNTNYNPHNGIAGYLGVTFMTVRTNGRMGFGWAGDWGAYGANGEPLYPFHFVSAKHQNTHSYLFRNDNNGSAGDGNGAGAIFVNTRGDHSWGVVAEFRIDQGAGFDKPSILFSQGNNSNTFTVGFGYNDADYFRINRDHGHRNSGWGTTLMLLDRSGNVTFTGNVTAYSDQRLKKNVTKIENALALVQQLEGVTFDYIEDNRPGLGMIAQEVEKILPVLVGEAPATNGITYKNIAYGNVVAVLIEAIKEQQKQIDELKNSRGIQS